MILAIIALIIGIVLEFMGYFIKSRSERISKQLEKVIEQK